MGKVKAFVPRSRLGCVTCKKRRVKCDETHPKCLKCERLKLECKFEQLLKWEDDAEKRGITFGRSQKARDKRIKIQTDKETAIGGVQPAKSDLKSHKDITIKRTTYFFISSSYDEFSKIYDPIGLTQNYNHQKGIHIKSRETKEYSHTISKSTDKTEPQTNELQLQKYRGEDGLIDMNDLVMFDNNLGSGESATELSGALIPLFSVAISRLFSPDNFSIEDNSQPSNLTIDDIFLQSFSSPLLTHSSPSLSPMKVLSSDIYQSLIPRDGSSRFDAALSMSSLEQILLNYFIESICPYCVCYPRVDGSQSGSFGASMFEPSPESNPYLYLIVPLAMRSPLVMKALLASSAKQLVLLGQKDYEEIAKNYSYQVLKDLPAAINDKQKSNEDNWDDVLATMIMLCFTEISVSCNNSWLVHLNGAKQFLKESCIQNNLSPVGKFFVRYFISHEVMAETAWVSDSDQQTMRPISDDPCIENLKDDADVTIDLVLGCSPYLISIIHKISVLGKCFEDLELESVDDRIPFESEILHQSDLLEQSLINLKQRLPPMKANNEVDTESATHTETIAEIKRLAALIYLFARIQLEYQFYHNPKHTIDYLLDSAKKYIKQIMELHASLPGCYVSLLWPIFIVGIVSTDEDERWFVLNSMTQMEKHRELHSVKSAKDVVVSVWKENDMGGNPIRWKEMIKGKANTISLA